MSQKPVSVYQLNSYIGRILATDPVLKNVSVSGEVSNLKFHQTGHVYFSLKDQRSSVRCFLHRERADKYRDILQEGMQAVVMAYINVYEPGGYYSLNIKEVQDAGVGDLALAFQAMKNKLEREGLFDPSHKLELPAFPKKVAIVTAKTGAALQDIIRIIKNRNEVVDISVVPVAVQGKGAEFEIADAIDMINKDHADVDVIIVGRGGGSAEDLWAFNEEIVARSIYDSKIPIISAVGHEVDFSISDFIADVRAATPTDAANIAVPNTHELKDHIQEVMSEMKRMMDGNIDRRQRLLDAFNINMMRSLMRARIENSENAVEHMKNQLEALNPINVIDRGFALVTAANGKPLISVKDAHLSDEVDIRFKDGHITAEIKDIDGGTHKNE